MAKLYHEGEYIESGGGTVASAIPSYYVELSSTPYPGSPIILPGASLEQPFKLVIRNVSDSILSLDSAHLEISDGVNQYNFKLFIANPSFKGFADPNYYGGSIAQSAFTHPLSINQSRFRANAVHEFIGSKQINDVYSLVQTDKYYANVMLASTHGHSYDKIYMYSEQGISTRPVFFSLTTSSYDYVGPDFKEDSSSTALTIGQIHFASKVSINQMPIFGNLKLAGVKLYDVNGVEKTGNNRNFAYAPFVLEFSMTGADQYTTLTLFHS